MALSPQQLRMVREQAIAAGQSPTRATITAQAGAQSIPMTQAVAMGRTLPAPTYMPPPETVGSAPPPGTPSLSDINSQYGLSGSFADAAHMIMKNRAGIQATAGAGFQGTQNLQRDLATMPGFSGLTYNQANGIANDQANSYQGLLQNGLGAADIARRRIEDITQQQVAEDKLKAQAQKDAADAAKANTQFVNAQYDQFGNVLSPAMVWDKDTQTLRPANIAGQNTPQPQYQPSSGGGFSPLQGMRTDRNNNPTAMTTDVAKTLGLKEGVDYTQGDPFKSSDGTISYTAKILGDPIQTTIKALDAAANDPKKQAFYTMNGAQRWDHTAIPDLQWLSMSPEQKQAFVGKMYQKEGGSGVLMGGGQPQQSQGAPQFSINDAIAKGYTSPADISVYRAAIARGETPPQYNPNKMQEFSQLVSQYQKSPLVAAADRTVVLKGTIENALKDPGNAANQLSLVYAYVQALDTYQSSVREGELNLVNSIDSKVGQLGNWVTQITNGQVVRPDVTKQIATVAKQLSDIIAQGAKSKEKDFASRANVIGAKDQWDQYISGFTPSYSDTGGTTASPAAPSAPIAQPQKSIYAPKAKQSTNSGIDWLKSLLPKLPTTQTSTAKSDAEIWANL